MYSTLKLFKIYYLFSSLLTLCSLSTCSLPFRLQVAEPIPTILPTPSKPWIVRPNKDSVCILAKFGAEFFINTTKTKTKTIIVNPTNAEVGPQSYCGTDIQVLQLDFNNNSLSLKFEKDSERKDIFVSQIVFKYKYSDSSVVYNQIVFKTPHNFGYKCFREQIIQLDERVRLNIQNVRLEAFNSKNYTEDDDSPEPWEKVGLKCVLDRVKSDAWQISSISVGVGVAVLTFITLVAIWSGRRQEKVMLKVKMMRQWTIEENRAFNARTAAAQNKSPVKKEFARSSQTSNAFENPSYADPDNTKF